jgi:hypothetical protein
VKRALFVGIDDYPTVGDLSGCVADATALEEILSRNSDGSRNWHTSSVTSDTEHVTRDRLRGLISELFANPRNTDLLFFFAGHGGQTPWGAELVTQDATENSLGVSMNDLLTLANGSPARSVTLILDCCFSGDLGNPPGFQADAVAQSFRLDKAVLQEGVTVMAASRSTEVSQESAGHGAFTRMLLDGLEGGATDHRGRTTALSLYGYISAAFDAWSQRPVLKTHLTEPVVLRIGPPWLDEGLLRQLPDLFPSADYRLQLTPAHEGEGRPLPPGNPGTPEQQVFDYLGRLRNANLVTTDEGRAHFWVALESGYVYLTPLGRYFWGLAKRGIL